jgi:mannosyl-oligosaccharide alpha-1,2-mannosidase
MAFLSDWNGRSNQRKMDHLVCFMPGLLVLGAYNDPKGLDSKRAQRDLAVGKALMYTCYQMYERQKTGIAPEYVEFPKGRDMVVGSTAPFYILRPETAESLFILNQLTGEPLYRDWAWNIWSSIEKHCKTASAYGSLANVNSGAHIDDRMESFFLAETIKYLYLAQDPDRPIDLKEYVFNTEAHPTRILDSTHKDVQA